MEINNIVIVSLATPKEKIWGQLLQLDTKGVTVRGIELNSFDDFVRQIVGREECSVGMTQVFIPCTVWSGSPSMNPAAPFPRFLNDSIAWSD